ncbi:MAG: xylulokinase, partial [Chloroflexi bacterium]
MPYLLGIDVSTTGVKALLIDQDGQVTGSANTEQPFTTPQPLWSEQDPAYWWSGAIHSIQQVLQETGVPGEAVQGVGLTGQMHGLTMLDETGKVLRPAILWNDQRTGAQCDEIR